LRTEKRIYYLTITFVIISSFQIQAQISSTLGWFEINYNQGCAPLEVSVKTSILEDQVPLFQFFGRDDPNPIAWRDSFDSLTNTYTIPGTYIVYLTVQNDPQRQDSLQVTVLGSEMPLFELKNCEGNGVLIEIQDNFYDSYIVDFGDGTVINVNSNSATATHFYQDTSTYIIVLIGRLDNAPNNCGSSQQSFTPEPFILPAYISRIFIDTLNNITINFSLPQNVNYRLEVSRGNDQLFQFFTNLDKDDTSITIENFSPDSQKYCFRIAALNPCGAQRVNSNVVCTISLELELDNNIVELMWQNVETGSELEYRIARNANTDYITVPSGNQTFVDRQVECETEYCYSVTTINDDGSESLSETVCGIAFSTDPPPTIDNVAIDIREQGVNVDWEVSNSIENYVGQFSIDNKLIDRDTTTFSTTFIETDLKTYPQTCYELTYTDECGNISQRINKICSILLQGISNPDGSISLQWSEFVGLKDSIENYSILKFDINDQLFETIPLGTSLDYVDEIDGTNDQIVKYVIEATPFDENFPPIHSNKIEVARQPQLVFPTAFTPNGDELNDFFTPEYLFIKTYTMQIYNRWGELLFLTEDPEVGWDGFFNGSIVPADSYTYLCNAEDFRGLKISRSGILVLLKN